MNNPQLFPTQKNICISSLFCLFLQAGAIRIHQDYFAYPKYDLQFENGNLTSLGSIEISSPLTTCYIPKAELTDEVVIDEPNLEKSLERLSQLPFEGRFWAYEFCYRNHINQFHPLPPNVEAGKDDVYVLSVYNSKIKSALGVENSEGGRVYHIVQEWADGDMCEITGKPRSTTVEYHCGQEERIVSMRELTTCHYKLVVSTPRLCSNIAFVRQKPSMAIKIKCSPPAEIVVEGAVDLETVADALLLKKLEDIINDSEKQHISVVQAVKNAVDAVKESFA